MASDAVIGQGQPAVDPGATLGSQQGSGIGGDGVASAVLEMAGKLKDLLQILTQGVGARAGEGVDMGLPGLTNALAAKAVMDAHSRHVRMERWLKEAGLADEKAQAPEYLTLLEAAREAAMWQAGRPVGVKDGEEQDDEEDDRGAGAQA
jgi:hypothetical protein